MLLSRSPQSFPTNAESYELLEECGRGVSATVRLFLLLSCWFHVQGFGLRGQPLSAQVWRARCKTLRDEIVAVKLLDLENVNCSLVGVVLLQTMKLWVAHIPHLFHCVAGGNHS